MTMPDYGAPTTLDHLLEAFEFLEDWEDRYRFILDLGRKLPEMPESEKTEVNFVHGCQSQVWLTHSLEADQTIKLRIDSDAYIVRGLISIVLAALNNKLPSEIIDFDIESLFSELELLEHLSPTRGNGLRALVQQIKLAAGQSVDR